MLKINTDGRDIPWLVPALVELSPGYTIEEWKSEIAAGYERTAGGEWFFQGEPFTGEVYRV